MDSIAIFCALCQNTVKYIESSFFIDVKILLAYELCELKNDYHCLN